jgi:uncharacterized protein YegP (UPF0339 family)
MYKFEYYEDKSGEWRWHVKHQNGNIIADSSEGYKNKQDMLDVIYNLINGVKYDDFVKNEVTI